MVTTVQWIFHVKLEGYVLDDGISFRIIYNINISVDIRSYPYIPMNSMDSNRWIVDGSPGLVGLCRYYPDKDGLSIETWIQTWRYG
jgi:hypothetical protein